MNEEVISNTGVKRIASEDSIETDVCPFENTNKKPKLEFISDNEEDASEHDNDDSMDLTEAGTDESENIVGESAYRNSTGNNVDFDDDSDIDELLEADIDETLKEEKGEYTVYEKNVLKRKQKDIFNVLPDNWVEITHDSGMPLYLHRLTRVATFGRPYFLGPGSAKHHKVPSSAIPCLYYKKLLKDEEHKKEQETAQTSKEDDTSDVLQQLNAPALEVKSTVDMVASDLTATELHEYAKNLFEFKKITYKKFKDWKKARAHFKELKKLSYHRNQLMSQKERPMLPSDTKIITVPGMEVVNKPSSREFRMNPAHKSALTVLHEYVQKVLKSSIEYDAISTGDPTMPYCAIAKIKASKVATSVIEEHDYRERFAVVQEEYKARLTEEGRQENEIDKCLKDMIVVGRGLGKGKKMAKMNAAAVALKLLMPDIHFDNQGIARPTDPILDEVNKTNDELSIFDQLEIENTMIPELSTKTGQPMPFVILQECLTKCATVANCKLETTCDKTSHTTVAYTLKIGDYSVTTTGTKKLECKQNAAQKVLAKLYPNFKSYGAILRLYGTHIKRQVKDQRLENKEFQKQNIASRASVNKMGTKKVESTGRFLESVMNHMIKYAEKASSTKDDIVNRSTMLTKDDAEKLALKSEERSLIEGDHFLEAIPKIWEL